MDVDMGQVCSARAVQLFGGPVDRSFWSSTLAKTDWGRRADTDQFCSGDKGGSCLGCQPWEWGPSLSASQSFCLSLLSPFSLSPNSPLTRFAAFVLQKGEQDSHMRLNGRKHAKSHCRPWQHTLNTREWTVNQV